MLDFEAARGVEVEGHCSTYHRVILVCKKPKKKFLATRNSQLNLFACFACWAALYPFSPPIFHAFAVYSMIEHIIPYLLKIDWCYIIVKLHLSTILFAPK